MKSFYRSLMVLAVLALAWPAYHFLKEGEQQADSAGVAETQVETPVQPAAQVADADMAAEEDPAAHPGYYDQWFELHKTDAGIIPSGLRSKWMAHDYKMQQMRGPMKTALASTEFIGPTSIGGRTRALLVDQTNPSRIYAGAISGGLWITTNGGTAWNPVNDQNVSLAISCITQNPFNANILYYGTGESRANSSGVPGDGVFKSTDNGNTFTQLTASTSISQLNNCWAIAHSKTNANTFYVGTNSGGLYRSTDAGASFQQVYNTGGIVDIQTFDDGSVLIARSSSGLYRSTTGNPGTFTQITSAAFPASFQRIEITACEQHQDTVYAAFESTNYTAGCNGFALSIDGGLTWTARTVPVTGAIYGRYCFLLGCSPNNGNRLTCGGVGQRYSTDAGNTWLNVSYGHADHHSFAAHPSDPNTFYIGSDGGVWRHEWSNPSSTKTDLNLGYHSSQFYAGDYAPTGKQTIGGTQDNGTFKIDQPTTIYERGGDGAYCHISQQNPDRAYSSTQNGGLARTSNWTTSASWSSIKTNTTMNNEGYSFINPYQINYADGEQLYCRTNQAMWRTVDAGTTWERLTNGSISSLYGIGVTPEANPTVYFGGTSAKFYRIDNAATATQGSEVDLSASVPAAVTNDYISGISVHPGNFNTLYIGFQDFDNNSKAWRVTNANTASPTWTDISGDLPNNLPVNYLQADPNDPDNVIFAGTDFGLYCTTNGGTNWVKETSVPNVSIHETKLRVSDRTLHLFTHGRGVWYAELNGGGSNECTAQVSSFPYQEGFESGLGLWTQDTGDDFDWTRQTGGTGSSGTGPSGASEGSYYVYTEASGSGYPSKTFILNGPCIDLGSTQAPIVKFDYHMLGTAMGTLDLQVSTDDGANWTSIWSLNGDQGADWNTATVSLAAYAATNFNLRFFGTTGTSFTSDMSVDNIWIGSGGQTCAGSVNTFPYNQNFDSQTICGNTNTCHPDNNCTLTDLWTNYLGDAGDWSVNSGSTPSGSTGPTSDHTSGSGKYMYFETSGSCANKTIYLLSPCFDFSTLSNPELSFWYHMYGATMGTLSVQASTDGGSTWSGNLFSRSSDQGNSWQQANVNLSAYAGNNNVLIRWTGLSGSSYTSDMAIDDVNIQNGSACASSQSSMNETFDSWSLCANTLFACVGNGSCLLQNGWTNDIADDIDWSVDDLATPSSSTGPSADHTSGSGKFLYVEASSCYNQTGRVITPCLNTAAIGGSPGVQFWYHMYGAATGSLTVQASYDGGVTWSGNLFSQSGDQGNAWILGSVKLNLSSSVLVRFTAVTGAQYTSDIAIDDVTLVAFAQPSDPDASTQPAAVAPVESKLMVYPTLADDFVNVVLSGVEDDTQIRILDMFGRVVKTVGNFQIEGEKQLRVDVSQLTSGHYLLEAAGQTFRGVERFTISR